MLVVVDRFGCHATQNAVTQRLNHFAAFNKRPHLKAVCRSAVVFDHNEVLCHIDKTTRQVTGVSGL